MRPVFRIVLMVAGTGVVSPACSSGGIDNSGGGAAGGVPSGGTTGGTLVCEPGLTRACVGPGACEGGQKCLLDGIWSDCDCGANGSGGSATGGYPSFGGYAPTSGGVGTGNVPVVVLGGYPPAIGGRGPVTFGGYPTASGGYPTTFGGYPTASGGGPSTGGSLNVTAGGYVQSSTYQGYAWTAAGPGTESTITPTDFASLVSDTQLCVSGSVGARPDYGGYAMLGINLNQATTGGTGSEGTYTPTGGSVTVGVTNTGGSTLWVQIQAPGGDTDANLRWCAILTGSGGTIALSSFNTKCWDNSGTAYAGQALQALMIFVPGGNATATSFNFCLTALTI